MHKAKRVPVKKPVKPETELRRWCIEQATRWPMMDHGGNYGAAVGGGMYRQPVEADLLGRTERIRVWVTK